MLNSNGDHVTKDGREIRLCDLTNTHLCNIINYIEKRARKGFYVAMFLAWPADIDSMCYQEDYVRGDEALSVLNYDAYVNELNRRISQEEKL